MGVGVGAAIWCCSVLHLPSRDEGGHMGGQVGWRVPGAVRTETKCHTN